MQVVQAQKFGKNLKLVGKELSALSYFTMLMKYTLFSLRVSIKVWYVIENKLSIYKITKLFLVRSCLSLCELMGNSLTCMFGQEREFDLGASLFVYRRNPVYSRARTVLLVSRVHVRQVQKSFFNNFNHNLWINTFCHTVSCIYVQFNKTNL